MYQNAFPAASTGIKIESIQDEKLRWISPSARPRITSGGQNKPIRNTGGISEGAAKRRVTKTPSAAAFGDHWFFMDNDFSWTTRFQGSEQVSGGPIFDGVGGPPEASIALTKRA